MNTSEHFISGGLSHWLRSFWLMFIWEFKSLRMVAPFLVIVQVLIGAGLVIGLGFLFADITPQQVLYLSTGTTVISMLVVGMVMVPQTVAQRKTEKIYDYLWSLPVPRFTSALATLSVWLLITVPGSAMALIAAMVRYNLELKLSLWLIPAALFTIMVSSSFGFAVSHVINNSLLIIILSQILFFVVLLYSPINYPPEQLPGWMAAIHFWLPFQHSATLMRATLITGSISGLGDSLIVLSMWAVISWFIILIVLKKKD